MEDNVDKSFTDPVTGKFAPGNPGGGRPPGQRNYATIYKEALIKLAQLNNKTPEELEDEMVLKALLEARKGSYKFYKDIQDRLHGKAEQKMSGDFEVTKKIISADE